MNRLPGGPDIVRGADISADGLYRYALWRRWSEGPVVTWVMLNPSTADGETDDNTIRRCVGFARDWKCGGIEVVNLFAFRATEPALALRAENPYGPENDGVLRETFKRSGMVVAAWGERGSYRNRDQQVLAIARDAGVRVVYCLGLTQGKAPRHPLYIRKSQRPLLFWTAPIQQELYADHVAEVVTL